MDKQGGNASRMIMQAFLAVLVLCGLSLSAQAQELCDRGPGFLDRPASEAISSNMGTRNLCKRFDKEGKKLGSCDHRGTDYRTPQGTLLDAPPPGCFKLGGDATAYVNGFGNIAQFDCGNGIKIQYAHLDGENAFNRSDNEITTGGSGRGGIHLDYILTLDGVTIDAQCATGDVGSSYTFGKSSDPHGQACPFSRQVDLCDPAIRQELKNHSNEVFSHNGKNKLSIPDGTTADVNAAQNGTQPEQGPPAPPPAGGFTGPRSGNPLEEPQPDPEETAPEVPEPYNFYEQTPALIVCENSTCITQDTIELANNRDVEYDVANSFKRFLTASACEQPTQSGGSVIRQIPSDTEEYAAAFCTNQGCSYIKEVGGIGRCE